jgi:hypothetical protein
MLTKTNKEELARGCYEWQKRKLKSESWTRKLREELDKIGLGYIWQDPQENSVSRAYKIIKERCSDIGGQNLFTDVREIYEMKLEWGEGRIQEIREENKKDLYLKQRDEERIWEREVPSINVRKRRSGGDGFE